MLASPKAQRLVWRSADDALQRGLLDAFLVRPFGNLRLAQFGIDFLQGHLFVVDDRGNALIGRRELRKLPIRLLELERALAAVREENAALRDGLKRIVAEARTRPFPYDLLKIAQEALDSPSKGR